MTLLAASVREKRGTQSLSALSREIGVSQPTLSRLEAGQHTPSPTTALALAKWLGWTLEQVYEAAGKAA